MIQGITLREPGFVYGYIEESQGEFSGNVPTWKEVLDHEGLEQMITVEEAGVERELAFYQVTEEREYWVYMVASTDNPYERNLWTDVWVFRGRTTTPTIGFYVAANGLGLGAGWALGLLGLVL